MYEVQIYGLKTAAGSSTAVPIVLNVDDQSVVAISGSITSVVATGPTAADVADDGSAPIQISGIARTANPTAVAANDVVKATFDKLGRQLTIPYQIRDLIATASVSLSTGTETTLYGGTAGEFHDLVQLSMFSNSDAAVTISIRDATLGGVVRSVLVPANGQEHFQFTVPIPQNAAADTWTVDIPDITGTTLTIDALFIRNI